MLDTLEVGATAKRSLKVGPDKMVPQLYPESDAFAAMPNVFATGYMVGLMEWACMDVLAPHLKDGEGSLGIDINVTHVAATVPGQTVEVTARCTKIDGRKVSFEVEAHDGIDMIGRGTHQRAVIKWDWFNAVTAKKAKAVAEAER